MAERLISVGDRDAAQSHVRATLTSAARGLLLVAGVFPLSRSELAGQLRENRLGTLGTALDDTIYREPSLRELTRYVGLVTSGPVVNAA